MELAHSWRLQRKREARGQRKLNVTEVLDSTGEDMNVEPAAMYALMAENTISGWYTSVYFGLSAGMQTHKTPHLLHVHTWMLLTALLVCVFSSKLLMSDEGMGFFFFFFATLTSLFWSCWKITAISVLILCQHEAWRRWMCASGRSSLLN